MTAKRWWSRLWRDREGATLVEGALTLPLVFMIVFWTVEVGYSLVD